MLTKQKSLTQRLGKFNENFGLFGMGNPNFWRLKSKIQVKEVGLEIKQKDLKNELQSVRVSIESQFNTISSFPKTKLAHTFNCLTIFPSYNSSNIYLFLYILNLFIFLPLCIFCMYIYVYDYVYVVIHILVLILLKTISYAR